MKTQRQVGILIFDEVEVLDFCGPFEVFSVAGRKRDPKPFDVWTCAERRIPVLARNQLSVNPSYTLEDCPTPDILILPGGWGTRAQMNNPRLLDWIQARAATAELVLSVCTGALLLAKAGLLEGLSATTHHDAVGLLREVAPRTDVRGDERFVDNGKFILSAGVAAGIDMSFYVIARLLGEAEARDTAGYIEYPWNP